MDEEIKQAQLGVLMAQKELMLKQNSLRILQIDKQIASLQNNQEQITQPE